MTLIYYKDKVVELLKLTNWELPLFSCSFFKVAFDVPFLCFFPFLDDAFSQIEPN